ncbi:MAG TPA: tRNA 2-selenouridine(34) synthase MnmH [Turneriella sp.]|nr:tRNA 2-selenouridine(34) synthase MnmH [Turneriella sp.]
MALPQSLSIAKFLALKIPYLDVRSEGEFTLGHIPHAQSMPLFNNIERAQVGTLYKQTSKEAAILKGFELVGPRLRAMAEQGLAAAHDNRIGVYCWRGGMRSASVAWLLESLGLEVYTLKGGYKAYRNFALAQFNEPRPLCVIGGKTGSRKTQLLGVLEKEGKNVIDLERLANHRGSAFGYADDYAQPTQEQFENDLAWVLFHLTPDETVFIEDESRLIGHVHIPDMLWSQLRRAHVVVLNWPLEKRVEFLTREYHASSTVMEKNIEAIKKRLGGDRYKEALALLAANDRAGVCRIMLDYYDRAYEYGLSKREQSTIRYVEGAEAFKIL